MDQGDELRLLRGACAASQTGAWHYRIGEDAVEWTPFLYDLFAVPETAELTLELALSFYIGKWKAQVIDAVKACQRDGTAWNLEVQCRSANGRVFWARTIGEAVYASGHIVALQGAFQDITSERVAVADRERAQAELAFVLRTMPDGFLLLDKQWRFTFVNGASADMLRRAPEDLVGRSLWDEFPDLRDTAIEAVYRTVEATGLSQKLQTYFEPLETWFDITVHPAQTGVAVHFRDVTREVRKQRDLRLFRTAIDAMTSGAVMLEVGSGPMPTWPVAYANVAAATLWGADRRGVLRQPFGDLVVGTTLHPGLEDIGQALGRMNVLEFEARRDGLGRRQIFNCIAVPLAGQDGGCGHAVILTDDVTEQRRSEEERHRGERLALIGQMAGGVSHDFNNLLAVILGNIELLEVTTDPDEARLLIAEARAAVMRGKALNDSLLAFAGKSKLSPRTADLSVFLHSVTPLIRRAVPSRIRIDVDIADAVPPVLLDAAMAESCLLNLVINAREAIEATGTIRIALGAVERANPNGEAPQTWVELSVEDSGSGIPEDLRDHVFEPFFTTRKVGQGSGLGLSRVRGYLEQIGGFVTLHSVPGQGTTVSMYFAVAPVDTRDMETAGPASTPAVAGHVKALVVDDTPAVARVVARMLTSLGCHALIAANGAEAREVIAREPDLDLMISDVVMPGETGVDLAHSVAASHPHIRIALMSGYSRDHLQSGPRDPAVVFLAKPVSRDQLKAFIASDDG